MKRSDWLTSLLVIALSALCIALAVIATLT